MRLALTFTFAIAENDLLHYDLVSISAIQYCRNSGYMSEVLVPSHTNPHRIYRCLVQDPEDPDVICECESFLYRGHCRHQSEALERVCGWIQGMDYQTPEQHRNRICPRCGGPTEGTLVMSGEPDAPDE